MSKKNLEDGLKNTKDALQCEIEFSSTRKLEITHLQTTLLEVTHTDVLEGPKLQVKLDLKEVENQRDNNLSTLLEALAKLDQVEGNSFNQFLYFACISYIAHLFLGEHKKLRKHSTFLEQELKTVKEGSQKLELELTVFKELLQQKENHIKKGDHVKMNQENLAISVSSSKKSDEVENLHQKMKEMEVDHYEQINNHMKKTNEATVSLM